MELLDTDEEEEILLREPTRWSGLPLVGDSSAKREERYFWKMVP